MAHRTGKGNTIYTYLYIVSLPDLDLWAKDSQTLIKWCVRFTHLENSSESRLSKSWLSLFERWRWCITNLLYLTYHYRHWRIAPLTSGLAHLRLIDFNISSFNPFSFILLFSIQQTTKLPPWHLQMDLRRNFMIRVAKNYFKLSTMLSLSTYDQQPGRASGFAILTS